MQKILFFIKYVGSVLIILIGIGISFKEYINLKDNLTNSAPPYIAFIYLVISAAVSVLFYLLMNLLIKHLFK